MTPLLLFQYISAISLGIGLLLSIIFIIVGIFCVVSEKFESKDKNNE